jgi:hypothetical protein
MLLSMPCFVFVGMFSSGRLLHDVLAVWGGLSRHPGCLGEIMGKSRPRDRFGDRCPTPFGAGTEQPCKLSFSDWLVKQYSDATKHQQPTQPITFDLLEMCRDTP